MRSNAQSNTIVKWCFKLSILFVTKIGKGKRNFSLSVLVNIFQKVIAYRLRGISTCIDKNLRGTKQLKQNISETFQF